MQSKAKGKGNLSVLMDYAGRRRVLTYLSWVLSAVSALTALVPFIFVWLIVREVIEANGNFAAVQGSLSVYGWWAVGSALISMMSDSIHPNDDGYEWMAEVIGARLRRLYEEKALAAYFACARSAMGACRRARLDISSIFI